MSRPLLRVLCLHGYRQNETKFRERSGAFRNLLKKDVEFVFLGAPHIIPEPANLARADVDRERAWWFYHPEMSDHGHAADSSEVCVGLEDSVRAVQDTLRTHGPFHGLLGFSQGAALAALLCRLSERGEADGHSDSVLHLSFALLIAGFTSQAQLSCHTLLHDMPIKMPTFHVIGSGDRVIPPTASERLLALCTDAQTYQHDGGHYMPASPGLKSALLQFLHHARVTMTT